MDMNLGSGSALLGGSSPIQEAMARRGQGVSATAQMSPAAMGFDPNAVPNQAPQGSPQIGGQVGLSAPSMPGAPAQSSEAQIIIEALSKRLDNDSKMNSKKLEMGMV